MTRLTIVASVPHLTTSRARLLSHPDWHCRPWRGQQRLTNLVSNPKSRPTPPPESRNFAEQLSLQIAQLPDSSGNVIEFPTHLSARDSTFNQLDFSRRTPPATRTTDSPITTYPIQRWNLPPFLPNSSYAEAQDAHLASSEGAKRQRNTDLSPHESLTASQLQARQVS